MSQNPVWFPNPLVDDASWAYEREGSVSWIKRSTLPRANEIRQFLNQNLAHLPPSARASFAHALAHRWQSAFFELVVARMVQEWGADLEIEVPNEEGRRPDLLARFNEGAVVVEATCPLYNQARELEMADKNPLVRVIAKLVPTGYRVGVWEVPRLSQSQSRHELKRAVQALFEPFTHISPEQLPDEGLELETDIEAGTIRLRIFAERILKGSAEANEPKSLFGPAASYMDDSISRIVKAVKAKRSQVRSSVAPVVLALHGGNLGADAEDFDQALIGHSWERIDFVDRQSLSPQTYVTARGFDPDGELYRRQGSDKPPTYAGVLGLFDVGVFGIKGWMFYPHPRFGGILPAPFAQLPSRAYDVAAQKVVQKDGKGPQEMNRTLNFAVT